MIRINNIKLSFDDEKLKGKAAQLLKTDENKIHSCVLVKKAVDARNKSNVHFVCSVNVSIDNEEKVLEKSLCRQASIINTDKYEFKKGKKLNFRPVIVGAGPSGLFCTLMLAEAGYRPILLERGKDVRSRIDDVNEFWGNGKFNKMSNVQFGEGGAGTFSDGKLTTGIKDVRCHKVLEEFVKYGATDDILYLSKPHIGTDKLCIIVENIRNHIIECGGEVRFENKVTDLVIEDNNIKGVIVDNKDKVETIYTENVVIAIGHSARDTFEMLKSKGIKMEQKPFSIGARIEHKQDMINKSQYGDAHKKLGAADYKLSVHLPSGRSVYTFCMCPGGVVVASSSEEGHIVVNGMSYYERDGENSNSALLVGIRPEDFGSEDVLAGMYLQRDIERKAFLLGGENYNAPAQLVGDFLENIPSKKLGNINPTYMPNVKLCDIGEVLPKFVTEAMREAIVIMDKQLKGFGDKNAVLTAPETRSSSPVRILRDENKESNIIGLYPCGEGAGYAGGIMSAAVDGIKLAEAIIKEI